MGYVQDKWQQAITGPDGKRKTVRTPLWGTGLRYRARWTDAEGNEKSKSFPDGFKEEAKAYAAAAATDVLRGTWIDPNLGRKKLADFITGTWLPAQSGAPSTRERIAAHVNGHILPGLGNRSLAVLADQPSIIKRWVTGLDLAPSTAGQALSVLSSVFAMALDDRLISRNPCRTQTVTAPSLPERLIEPWGQVLAGMVRAEVGGRYRALVDAGLGLGVRQGEALALGPDRIDREQGCVHVTRQLRLVSGQLVLCPPKGDKTRDVPLTPELLEVFDLHAEEYSPATVTLPWLKPGGKLVTVDLMFTTPRGRPVRATYWDREDWKPAVQRAGLPGERKDGYHILRHTFASLVLASGCDVRKLATWLGHNDPAYTMRTYVQFIPDTADRMRQAVGAFLAGTAQDRPGDLGKVLTARSEAC